MLTAQDLTNGERLLLCRRRASMTKTEAARRRSVTLYRYNLWERDEDDAPPCPVGRVAFFEQSLIVRLRAGVSVADFAAVLEVSPWWLRQMETGEASDVRLREWWGSSQGEKIAAASR